MDSLHRLRLIQLLVVFLMLGLLARVFYLMVNERHFLLGQGDARALRTLEIPAYRGMITDRNGYPLAISTPVDSIWIDPQTFNPTDNELAELSNLTQLPAAEILNIDNKNQKKEFVYLTRDLPPYIGEQIHNLGIPGVFIQQAFHRYYPDGEVSAQLLGFTNIDDQGQEGIELQYNNWLSGIPGKKKILQDRYGREVASLDLIHPTQPGHDLALSIDRRIQYIAYTELQKAVNYYHAQNGSMVVMDAKTGEVLAMVNQPSYNPNNRPSKDNGGFRNRAVTDVFEPGSTTKAFVVVNGLMSGKYTPDTIIDTRPGYLYIGKKRVRDDSDFGVLTTTGVLQYSSNVGATKITLSLPPDSLWQMLHKIGYGQKTESGFPGESPGVLIHHHPWKPFTLATMSFGYGLSVTNLQLARAYSILANNGVLHPVSLLRLNTPAESTKIIPGDYAKTVVNMLQSVVEKGGTATTAQIPGYRVSGKTGTVQIAAPGGYERNHHTAIFAGIAPVSDPRIVAVVEIKDPKGPHGEYFGGEVSAPVFATVVAAALRILNVPPDNIQENQPVKSRPGVQNDAPAQAN